jgi:UDP-N-acetylmuramate dehydrogenase
MNIQQHYSLKQLNTFGINATCSYFTEASTAEELKSILSLPQFKHIPKLILGGGSNILFTQDFDGLVIKNNIKGIILLGEDESYYYVKAGAGVVWHDLVLYCINNNYGGLENLSLIPGSVGAGPIQNIGAYGVEIKDYLLELEALEIETLSVKTFSNVDCKFGYRNSVFKTSLKNKYIITSVTYRLLKNPVLNTSYGAIEQELQQMGVKNKSIKAISDAVCNIRNSKLPNPAVLGNAGSFFKNPEITEMEYNTLKDKHPNIVGYNAEPGKVKVAAGWLIEQCGWKGKTLGHAGVHKNQSLVLVNYGQASGNEIYNLSEQIIESVKNTFGILLEREVNIL